MSQFDFLVTGFKSANQIIVSYSEDWSVIPLEVVWVQLNRGSSLSFLSYRLYFNLLWQNYNLGLIVLIVSVVGICIPDDFL